MQTAARAGAVALDVAFLETGCPVGHRDATPTQCDAPAHDTVRRINGELSRTVTPPPSPAPTATPPMSVRALPAGSSPHST